MIASSWPARTALLFVIIAAICLVLHDKCVHFVAWRFAARKSQTAGISPDESNERSAKLEALSGVLHQIERSYGKGSIQKLGESSSINVETTPSGSLTLDIALGGGYPKGRVVEIYGPESSGKT